MKSLTVRACVAGLTLALAAIAAAAPARTAEPIKIGFGMALTGGLSANGKSALLAMKIWEEDINATGGLLGRPVRLVYYDDQSNPATVPALFTKLLEVDKVDLVVGDYGTNLLAPAMPVIMSHNMIFIGLFGLAVNSVFNYPNPMSRERSFIPVATLISSGATRLAPASPSLDRARRMRSALLDCAAVRRLIDLREQHVLSMGKRECDEALFHLAMAASVAANCCALTPGMPKIAM